MEPIIQTERLSHIYSAGTPFEHGALVDVDFTAYRGEYLGIIGHTGSGKSTLIQHLNGLLKPTSGRVLFEGKDIWESKERTRQTRFQVGLVFQYPEYQLFEETVYKDIAFGPGNMGLEPDEIDRRVRQAAQFVGLKEETLEKSPFELSGGQKRRVAIAGVIAMEPSVLILDEPTSNMDTDSERLLQRRLAQIARGRTLILITHRLSMLRLVDRLIILKEGRIVYDGPRDACELFHPKGQTAPQTSNAQTPNSRALHPQAAQRTQPEAHEQKPTQGPRVQTATRPAQGSGQAGTRLQPKILRTQPNVTPTHGTSRENTQDSQS